MPMYIEYNFDEDPKRYYKSIARYITGQARIDEYLRNLRRNAVKEQEYWRELQKIITKDKDFEGAKFCKQQINYWLRVQNAVKFYLPWFGVPDANQEYIVMNLWPEGLCAELDEIARELVLYYETPYIDPNWIEEYLMWNEQKCE